MSFGKAFGLFVAIVAVLFVAMEAMGYAVFSLLSLL